MGKTAYRLINNVIVLTIEFGIYVKTEIQLNKPFTIDTSGAQINSIINQHHSPYYSLL